MISKTDQRRTEEWWLKQMVRTTKQISNGWMTIPAGTVCKVTRKWKGLSLKGEPCDECGIQAHISRVGYEDLEIAKPVWVRVGVRGEKSQHLMFYKPYDEIGLKDLYKALEKAGVKGSIIGFLEVDENNKEVKK